jgi:putative hydrolase of the HAD superfamily
VVAPWARRRVTVDRMAEPSFDPETIRAVILDYTGVMTVPIPFTIDDTPSVASDKPSEASVGNVLRSVMATELRNPNPEGMWNRLERGEIALSAFADHVSAMHPMAGEFFRSTAGTLMSTLPIRPEMVERLRTLKAAGFKTALLTNNVFEWRDLWRAKLIEANAIGLFDVLVDSSDVGMRKPEARIYRHTTGVLGVEPRAALFVDDFAHNVDGAREAGLNAVFASADDAHFTELDRLPTGINFPDNDQ